MSESPAVPTVRRFAALVAGPSEDLRVGGQAVIEGVMMRGRRSWALAVRKPDGSIHTRTEPLTSFLVRHPGWDRLFIRGIFVLGESMVLGWRALSASADIALEEETEGKGIGWIQKTLSITMAVLLAIGLFILLPTWLAPRMVGHDSPVLLWNIVEGGLRLAFFIVYLLLVSLSKEMRRVFEYHGAEHQSIHLLENNYPLEPEWALREGTDHIRCGTSFLLLVLVITVIVYSFLGKPPLWLRVVERVAIIPLVAGISYEIMKFADRSRSPWTQALMAPGLALQRLTTRQPEREQAEVALAALGALMEKEDLKAQG
jgi:uncharacterized protein YqhQ